MAAIQEEEGRRYRRQLSLETSDEHGSADHDSDNHYNHK